MEPLAPGALGADPETQAAETDGLFTDPGPLPLSGLLAETLTEARAGLDGAQQASLHTATLDRDQRLEALRRAAEARHVADAVVLRLISTFTPDDVRGVGATDLVDLLVRHTGADPRRASPDTKLAAALAAPPVALRTPAPVDVEGEGGSDGEPDAGEQDAPGVGSGSSSVLLGRLGAEHAAGRISTDVAALAHRVIATLPARLRKEHMAAADTALAAGLPGLTYPQAQAVTSTLAHTIDPDRADRGYNPDDLERRYLSTTLHDDGWMDLHGRFDPLAAAAITVALAHLSKPQPTVAAPTADGDGDGSREDDGIRDGVAQPSVVVRDERTAKQRRADAVETMARRVMTDDETRAGEPPRIMVTSSADQLAGTPGAGQATCESTGRSLTRTQLLHLACSGVLQAVRMSCEGPDGAPLSLGRAVRIFTASQRRAMLARDGGCAIPGCTAPPGWLEAHHVVEWCQGGATDVDSGCLLCHRHHLLVTLGVWEVRMVDGVVQVRPPRNVDPLRRWLLNPRKALVDATVRRVNRLVEQLVLAPPGGWRDEPPDPPPTPAPDIPSRRGTCTC